MKNTGYKIKAFCVAGTSSGDGKTTVTLALLRALRRRGLDVQPFKCGPDYIDPTFHKIASGEISRNLDCWMMGKEQVINSFAAATENKSHAVIEGVMGLFDSSRPGSLEGSTAETCSTLKLPVILVVNCKGIAGSIAAIAKGYSEFHPDIKIIGIIANKVGSENHAAILRKALEAANMPPLLGYLKRNEKWILPERHLGLIPFTENSKTEEWFDSLANEAEKCFEIDKIMELCEIPKPSYPVRKTGSEISARLALARDKAFHFYYQDNLEMLKNNGIEILEFSPLNDHKLPDDINGVYIGGGFPETFASELEGNQLMRQAIKSFAEKGGIIYAECGGFMYLCSSIKTDDEEHKMCGIIPAEINMDIKLRSLGYREVKTCTDSFFGPAGTVMRGHEFHWSGEKFTGKPAPLYEIKTASQDQYSGKCGCQIGKNICASYIHLHWASNPEAAASLSETLKKTL